MANKYSIFSLIKNALSYHENWQKAWRDPPLKKEYDAVIVGGGGHGLATAYYLAKKHNMKNIAVVEKSWIGGGNTGRNTTIIRSNYLWDASAGLYDHALKLWEGLSQEIITMLCLVKERDEPSTQLARCKRFKKKNTCQ